jgi:4-amino-4-deoxy-L-arabinose transferase-like glycosyltransferase
MTRRRWIALGLWAIWAFWALAGLRAVPFHPDESTHLFTSQDFEQWFNPAANAYSPAQQGDLMQHYRLIDAPLSRYLVGLTRALAGFAPLPADWNWSLTWDKNAARGALPSAALNWVGRIPAALALIVTPLGIAALARAVVRWPAALLAAALYALNALILLHTRRAMSESLMLCFNTLTLALLLRATGRWAPLWIGLCAGLALAAKLTGVAVIALALIGGALWPRGLRAAAPVSLGFRAQALGLTLGGIVAITLLFNPIVWTNPQIALPATWAERQKLLADQVATVQAVAPNTLLNSPGVRGLAIAYQLYVAPLQFWEVPNYAEQTRAAEAAYAAQFLHALGRGPHPADNFLAGGLGFALTLLGLMFGFRATLNATVPPPQRRALVLLLIWTGLTAAGLLTFPIAWQRYYLPLIPPLCVWGAYAVAVAGKQVKSQQENR